MKRSLLQWAEKNALQYYPKHPQRKLFSHYCYVVQNNQIVEWATNTVGEPPKHMGYHTRINAVPKSHAELNAFRKAKGLLDFRKDWEVINVRIGASGMKMSKPCKCCHDLLATMGCVRFWYSSEVGFLKA